MKGIYYIGLDIHKRTISFCVKTVEGRIVKQGSIKATREALRFWVDSLDRPWVAAMEATIFTGWIYDFLQPFAQGLKVAHPKMLKAIACAKKKNDKVDAQKISDLLRCDLLPECHMASPEIRELRRVLRFRNLLVRQGVRMHNRMTGLLMEVGEEYEKKKLKGRRYFEALVGRLEETPQSVIDLLRMSRGAYDLFVRSEKTLVRALRTHNHIRERVELLMTIPGVGEIVALTWALEIGDPAHFSSAGRAMSYCGLTSAQRESAGKQTRGPLSKDRNKHLQTILIEAAKIAPVWNEELAELHERELARGNHNQATIAVARKMVEFLLAVDRRRTVFVPKTVATTGEDNMAASQAA